MRISQRRLTSSHSGNGSLVRWQAASVFDAVFDEPLALWHDRALLHFFTDDHDVDDYVNKVCRSVRSGGWIMVSTFADDGPEQCSGLVVRRYNEKTIAELFSSFAVAIDVYRSVHCTPWGSEQRFLTLEAQVR